MTPIYHLRHATFAIVAVVALCFPAQAQAPLDVRIALVIGNSAYVGAPLVNPANDARAMSETLSGLGFRVIELRDAQRAQMADAIGLVRDSLQGKQGIGMLYYAGHGLQLDWQNYMVPVDAKLAKATDVPEQAVNINRVIDAFKLAGNRMNILVLDACRDNPFAGTASGKGLAPLDAPTGTFLAYATAPGNVAEDGDATGGNGLYTQYLLEELKKPTSRIEDVFKRVRFNVRQKSQGRQIPWESTSLEDDFFFNTGKVVAPVKPSDSDRGKAFDTEKSDWDKIKDSKNADDFFAFLKKYPSGSISEAAQGRLEVLAKPQIAAVTIAGQTEPVPRSVERFRLNDKYFFVEKDGYTNLEVRRQTMVVTGQNGDNFEVNNGAFVFTGTGGTTRITLGSTRVNFDPPLMIMPAGDFQLGKTWKTRSTIALPFGFKGWMEGDSKIIGREKIVVEAGEFDTYKMEFKAFTFQGTYTEFTYWIDPAYGWPIKLRRMERNGGKVTAYLVQEMAKKPERS